MTLKQLVYAIMIAETGTFIEAAKKLYISQSSLSFSIKGLEEELNTTLFVRTHKGIMLTEEGKGFIREAKKIVLQTELLNEKFSRNDNPKERFSISTQHYTFVSLAFAELVNQYKASEYELTLNETKTLEVIEDVSRLRSEMGIIYLSKENEPVICKILKENRLTFRELFTTDPYILVGIQNPLSKMDRLDLLSLTDYPCISFVQDDLAPHFFSEEIISFLGQKRNNKISDRGALADLLGKTNAFVVSTGIYLLNESLNKTVAIPLDVGGGVNGIKVGLLTHKDSVPTPVCESFCSILNVIIESFASQTHEKRYF
jgi:DNA-binding transcriptional LysR family regulator